LSRVTLAGQRDALGVPQVQLDWRLSALDKHSARSLVGALGAELQRLGAGTIRISDWLLEESAAWPVDVTVSRHPIGGYHHLGTTRMSADPHCGVVDSNCRVHGCANLFVAGSSVFATGGWANPTLTILALALRLGDHLDAGLE
jgi:choline dehydrogenase-like flavoprotein